MVSRELADTVVQWLFVSVHCLHSLRLLRDLPRNDFHIHRLASGNTVPWFLFSFSSGGSSALKGSRLGRYGYQAGENDECKDILKQSCCAMMAMTARKGLQFV